MSLTFEELKLTLDELKQAVRAAENLDELKKLVGPSVAEAEAARERVRLMDVIWNQFGGFADMPPHALDQYNRLQEAQNAFENMYC